MMGEKLQGIIIALVIVGFVLGIAFLSLGSFEEQLGTNTTTVTNETVTAVGVSGKYVLYNSTTSGVGCYHDFAPTMVSNATGGEVLASGNYTYEPASGKILIVSGSSYTGKNLNVTYVYTHGDNSEACQGIGDTVDATQTIPSWLPTIIIIMIVGIILYFTLKAFSGSKTGKSVTAEI